MNASHINLSHEVQAKLTGAILLYTGGDTTLATRHRVIVNPTGQARLAPGEVVQPSEVADLGKALIKQAPISLLPANTLAWDGQQLMWWTPEQDRRLWFHRSDQMPAPFRSILCRQPALVWQWATRGGNGHSLWVYALRKNERPTATTSLLRPPYHNVSDSGAVCLGSSPLPEVVDPQAQKKIEEGFYASAFTHSNAAKIPLCSHPGGIWALWPDAKSRQPFPVRHLSRKSVSRVGELLL